MTHAGWGRGHCKPFRGERYEGPRQYYVVFTLQILEQVYDLKHRNAPVV